MTDIPTNVDAPPIPSSLTPRQEAFASHYATCRNGAEAARRAGYKESNARYAARDNLRNDAVRGRIRALAAAQAEQRRDETLYLLMMLNAAMESALRQDLPNPMIRALALMARMTGLDKPAPALPAGDEETDGDAPLAFADISAGAGLIQEAIDIAAGAHVQKPHDTPTEHHKTPHPEIVPGESADPHDDVAPAASRGPYAAVDGTFGADDASTLIRPEAIQGDTQGSATEGQPATKNPDVPPALGRSRCDAGPAAGGTEDPRGPDRVRGDERVAA